jgi:hypothetical protein
MEKEQQRLDSQGGPGRLWIPQGQKKDVVWVDDDPFCIHEHNPKMGGNYRNWMTCLRGAYEDATCCQILGPNSRYYCGYVTAVDCSEWTDNRGNKHQYEMRLVQLKMKTLKKFRRKKEDKGSLVGTMWELLREDDRSPTCGDEWSFQRDVDTDKLFPYVCYRGKKLADLWAEAEEKAEVMTRVQSWFQIKPDENGKLPKIVPAFNYMEILKPMVPKDARLFLGAVEADDNSSPSGNSGSKSGGAGTVKEDNVPF